MIDDFHKQITLPDFQGEESGFYPIPQKIGPYKIESLLNKGGMSLLYLGIHAQTTKPIVIKVLLPKFLKNKEIADRFLKEAQIIGITDHPNIVKLYGQGQWEKGLYIAMEFIQGISLRQFIQQKSLCQKRALEIVLQVAYALCHLHNHGVIHRDLKPENILITETGEIKVIDFGIAQLEGEIQEQKKHPPSKLSKMMGTPAYMSPEQKENPHQVSFASDLFSLGVIAYELLLGRLSHGVIHPSLLPKSMRKIIETALKADPKERYRDMIDFITDISECIRILSDEKSEKEKEEASDEVLEMIQQARSVLIPKKAPRWPQVEIGIAIQESASLNSLYIDFFQLPESRFGLILAEPIETGITSLLHLSAFRGMVRMSVALFFQNGKKEHHPIPMLNAINSALCDEEQKFRLSLLLLNPERDQLSFISCHASNLWHVPDRMKKMRILTTPNPSLGTNLNTNLLETADHWNPGDLLVLHSIQGQKEDPPSSWIGEHLPLSPQPQAEKILQSLIVKNASSNKRTSAVLTIHRIF